LPERLYHGSVRVLSILFVVVGVFLLAVTLAAGGGPLSLGVLMGVCFVGIGIGRFWVASRMTE